MIKKSLDDKGIIKHIDRTNRVFNDPEIPEDSKYLSSITGTYKINSIKKIALRKNSKWKK